jgi:PAS domain S-box-containing protein
VALADPAFRAIFEDAPFGIVVVDKDLKIVDINAAYCEMLGYTEAEMLRLSVAEITHPEDRPRDAEFLALLLSGALPRYRAEKRYIAKDGQVVPARITVRALLEQGGESRFAFSMVEPLAALQGRSDLVEVCTRCRSVRSVGQSFVPLDEWLRTRAGAVVKDAVCPSCSGA